MYRSTRAGKSSSQKENKEPKCIPDSELSVPELSLLSGATLVMELTNGDSAAQESATRALDMLALFITLHRYAAEAPGFSLEPGIS